MLAAAAVVSLLATPAAATELASCKMTFNMSGWSLIYKTMKGTGKVTCSNGQSAEVKIKSNAVGFTIGKSDVLDGEGTFSEVKDIGEIYGTYVQAEASGSVSNSA